MINPDSEWQEDILIPGVTLYDVQREPRQTVSLHTEDTLLLWRENSSLYATGIGFDHRARDTPVQKSPGAEVAVPVEQVESELTCPICLSILRDTTIVMECLHRFCNECLKRSMIERMECPSCRQHIPSRRSLRRDLNFDGLIRAIFPDLDLHDRQKQEKATADNNAKHPRLATSTSSTSGGRGGGAAAAAAPTTMTHTPPAAAAPLEAVAPNPAAAGKKRKSSQPEGQGGTSSIAPTMLNFQLHLDPREDRVMPLEKKVSKLCIIDLIACGCFSGCS
jgi:hypothetical protein